MNPDFCSSVFFNDSDPSNSPQKDNSDKRLLELMTSFLKKQDINPDVIDLYKENLRKIRQIGVIAQAIDKKQFKEPEFLFFLNLKNKFLQGTDEHKRLNQSLRLLKVAIDAKNSFLRIEQIESMYRNSYQQELYQLVFDLLSRNVSAPFFYNKVHEKLHEVLPLVKTEKAKNVLCSYVQELDSLVKQDKLGLRLLYLFKKYQLTDYSILGKVSDVVTYLSRQEVKDFDYVLNLITTYY